MKNIMKSLILLAAIAFWVRTGNAQTATPNTTLCAAQTKAATTVCLTSTTNVVNQTGVYVDGEYETVILSASQSACAGPCAVPVRRNSGNAGSGPTAHANASIAWLAYTPSQSLVPGVNGFSLSTTVGAIGTCTRTSEVYLPIIYVNRNIKRDCTTTGVWVDYAPQSGLDYPSPTPLTALSADQTLSVSSGNYIITKSGSLAAITLTAPTSGVQDGMVIIIRNGAAYASTLTATSLLETGGGSSPYSTATFGATTAYVGASLTLVSYGGKWYVLAYSNVTFS